MSTSSSGVVGAETLHISISCMHPWTDTHSCFCLSEGGRRSRWRRTISVASRMDGSITSFPFCIEVTDGQRAIEPRPAVVGGGPPC